MIGLVDGNNFFVSCERIFDLKLENKPVGVLSNNDGCVVARSNEFKALNIPMGTPYFKLKPYIERYGLILKSSNYELYGDISRRIVSVLTEFTPEVDPYSIDESFIYINLPESDSYYQLGIIIHNTILRWIGVPCGVGFAKSKTLAKIANHIGKKMPSGVFVMPNDPEYILKDIPVEEIWGVGRRLAPQMRRIGIETAWDLSLADDGYLRKKFSINTVRTAQELRGIPVIPKEDNQALSHSITCSRSFGQPVTDINQLYQAVFHYLASACEKLRKEKQEAKGLNLFLQYYGEYAPVTLPQGYSSSSVIFPEATDFQNNMFEALKPHLQRIFMEGRRYKKAGIMLYGLEPKKTQQLNLFTDTEKKAKENKLTETIDKINRLHGRNTIFSLAQGIDRQWMMKRDMLTPNYTTCWKDIPKVR